ncbi:hypothetical protein EDD21DRAFT_415562 [Dissophora ornata]|nr:hypothetical protein EDD21DRAFT_415562 [Dissophora ornata]
MSQEQDSSFWLDSRPPSNGDPIQAALKVFQNGPIDASAIRSLDRFQSFAFTELPDARVRLRHIGHTIRRLAWEFNNIDRLAFFDVSEIDGIEKLHVDMSMGYSTVPIEIARRNKQLLYLYLTLHTNLQVPIPLNFLHGHHALKSLTLRSIKVKHKDFRALAGHCPQLQNLHLCATFYSKETIIEKINVEFPNLTTLTLEDMKFVPGLIASCPRLDVLCLSWMTRSFMEQHAQQLLAELAPLRIRGLGLCFYAPEFPEFSTVHSVVAPLIYRDNSTLKELRIAPDTAHNMLALGFQVEFPSFLYHGLKVHQCLLEQPFSFESIHV